VEAICTARKRLDRPSSSSRVRASISILGGSRLAAESRKCRKFESAISFGAQTRVAGASCDSRSSSRNCARLSAYNKSERERGGDRPTAENAENQRRNPQRITRRNCVATTQLEIKARSFGLDRFRPCWSKPNVHRTFDNHNEMSTPSVRFDMTINTACATAQSIPRRVVGARRTIFPFSATSSARSAGLLRSELLGRVYSANADQCARTRANTREHRASLNAADRRARDCATINLAASTLLSKRESKRESPPASKEIRPYLIAHIISAGRGLIA